MKKYEELVVKMSDEIARLKELEQEYARLANESKQLADRAIALASSGYMDRAADLHYEAQDIEKRKFEVEHLIREYERDIDIALERAYKFAPGQARRQGIAGFYREAGLS